MYGYRVQRRDLLAALVAAAAMGEGQQSPPETIYIPKVQRVEDRQLLYELMDEFAFADLITAAPSIRVTHIPTLLDRNAGPYGTIYGHVAKNNEQEKTFDGASQAVIVFHGPESYISPTWYEKAEAVPTWNFAVVHASGKLKAITDPAALHGLLAKLIDKFEGRYPNSKYDFSKLPDSYVSPLLRNIVGFEMKIEELEGKYKLGQERSEADRQSIVQHLPKAWREPGMAEFTAAFYERQKKSS